MADIEILHFEQLKQQIQVQYLKNHTPSEETISKWKGIDIIYFQEDLRKRAKGNISEKSFYTYFKSTPATKAPRIDMLNLFSVYAGYESWYDFKKQNPLPENLLKIEEEKSNSEPILDKTESSEIKNIPETIKNDQFQSLETKGKDNLQINATENQKNTINPENNSPTKKNSFLQKVKEYLWLGLTIIFGISAGLLGFKDQIFGKTYEYTFTDADRGSNVQSELEIKVFKDNNESPLFYRLKPGESFYYPTKDSILRMEISSPLYENLTINRNLTNAPKEETIEMKPDDYKVAVYFFSKKDISGNPDPEGLISQKRSELEKRISNNAEIFQLYDNDTYGLESLSKEKYITLVTTPTTSLKNLKIIDMKKDKQGKITSIKFKITPDEKN